MGAFISKQLDESFEKQKAFQTESQRLQVMRQLSMQNLMRERMAAMQIARARDTFYWVASFAAFAAVGTTLHHLRTKDPRSVLPLIPVMFVTGYFYDLAHGDKMLRIKREAENILVEDPDILAMPLGLPTFNEIENRRDALRQEEHYAPNELFL